MYAMVIVYSLYRDYYTNKIKDVLLADRDAVEAAV